MAVSWTDKYVTAGAAGGGAGTEGDPWTLTEAETNAVAGYRLNCLAGDYTKGTATAFTGAAGAGTFNLPIWWRGYLVVPGDVQYPVVFFDSKGASAAGAGAITKSYQWFENFQMEDAVVGWKFTGSGFRVVHCAGWNLGDTAFWTSCDESYFIGCAGLNYGHNNAVCYAFEGATGYQGVRYIGCYAGPGVSGTLGTKARGFIVYVEQQGCFWCIADRTSQVGYLLRGVSTDRYQPVMMNCIASRSGTSGIHIQHDGTYALVNCIIENNGGFGITAPAAVNNAKLILTSCAFLANASGNIDTADIEHVMELGEGEILLPRSAFMDSSVGDFRISGSCPDVVKTGYPENFWYNELQSFGGGDLGPGRYAASGKGSVVVAAR